MTRAFVLACLALASCSGDPGTLAAFDLTADLAASEHFYDFPYPSDLRLTGRARPI
jgi:hypothetical protein